MRVVTHQLEIFELEIVNVFHCRIQFHPRQRSEFPRKLLARLFEMVFVKMKIAESMNKIARRKANNLRDHHGKQRVRGDIERNAEKKICASLIKLATELAVLDIKLKEQMTRRQRHLINFRWI